MKSLSVLLSSYYLSCYYYRVCDLFYKDQITINDDVLDYANLFIRNYIDVDYNYYKYNDLMEHTFLSDYEDDESLIEYIQQFFADISDIYDCGKIITNITLLDSNGLVLIDLKG